MQKAQTFPIIQRQEKFIVSLRFEQQSWFVGNFSDTQHDVNEHLVQDTDQNLYCV